MVEFKRDQTEPHYFSLPSCPPQGRKVTLCSAQIHRLIFYKLQLVLGGPGKVFLMYGLMIIISMTMLMWSFLTEKYFWAMEGMLVSCACTCLALRSSKPSSVHLNAVGSPAVMQYELKRSLLKMSPYAAFLCWGWQLCQCSNLDILSGCQRRGTWRGGGYAVPISS